MTVADASKRREAPAWFRWLQMVATLTLAAFMLACIETHYWTWGVMI